MQAALDFSRRRDARALEAYPMVAQPCRTIAWDEIHFDTREMFAAAGLIEMSRPTVRRVVMRIEL